MMKKFLIAFFGLALLMMVYGCSENSAISQDENDDMAADFGGFTPTDEDPAFGDPDLLGSVDEDAPVNDPLLASAAVTSVMEDSKESGTYALRIVWGSLEYDETISEVTDWSGSLTISRGAEIIRRVIRFEEGQDYILERTDRTLIEWVSLTTVHHDGIFVNLYVPPVFPDDPNYVDEPVIVTFTTGPFTLAFEVSEVASMDTIYYLDDEINAVAFTGFKICQSDYPKGFLAGGWGKDENGQGIFKGRWISQHGALAGYLEGTWGEDQDGNEANMFFGKWIDLDGNFEGLLRGEYKPAAYGPSGTGHMNSFGGGWFRGMIYDDDSNPLGVLRGHYMMARCDCNGMLGYFKGRWKIYCPDAGILAEDDGME